MRLHTLVLQAFGPFPDRQVVDFDELSGSGLFLLEGPTGAGKTSVLDAITYGLYGELSSDASTKDKVHSDFADPASTPEVTLEWSVRGRRLRITRSPEHERPRKRGQGTTRAAAAVHLQELAGGSWSTLSTGKAETAALVGELMGLNRAQFTQVVLLPQGEFARFLRADDDDRRALLTRLFGTHLYDRITAELDRRRQEAEQARREARHHVEQALAAAGQAAGLDADARQALVALGPSGHDDELDSIETALTAAAQQAEVALDLAATDLTLAAAAKHESELEVAVLRRALRARQDLQAHEAGRQLHERRVATLARARRAEPVRPLLQQLAEADAAVRAAQDRLRTLVPDPGPKQLRGTGAAAAAQLAATTDLQAARLDGVVALEATLRSRQVELATGSRQLELAHRQVEELTAAGRALPDAVAGAHAELTGATAVAALLPQAQERLDAVTRRREAAVRLPELDAAIATQHTRWRTANQDREASAAEHERLTLARLTGMSAELAAALRPGSPCGVCGSREHPAPASPVGEVVTAADVTRAAAALEQAQARSNREERALRTLTNRREVLSGTLGGATLPGLDEEYASAESQVRASQQATHQVEAARRTLAELAARQATTAAGLMSATAEWTRAGERCRAAAEAIAADSELVAAELAGHRSVAARREELARRTEQLRDRAAVLATLATAWDRHQDALGRAGDEAGSQGFADLAEAEGAVLDPVAAGELAEDVADWEKRLAAIRAALEDPELAMVDGSDPDTALARLGAAEQQWALADAAHRDAAAEHTASTRTAKAWSQCLTDLSRAKAAHARTERQTAAVIRLAALAKGVDGQRRVALTTYVLRHWFAQVVRAANLRLATMSAGRYELERSDEAQSRAQRAGLTLTVIDRYTGERRHPRSLSGGETFFTSLALALGLAEVVKAEAGGVDLDTLFIDEGFGTLDPATLDQVMTVIDELRDGGRVVGIVSHLADLKERVPERLEARRAADGSSRLRVVV